MSQSTDPDPAEAEADDALRWLSRKGFSDMHRQAQDKRMPGTLKWIADAPQFRRWLDEDRQVLLYMNIPGSGKTIAVSQVVDTLLERFGTEDKIGIAFFYPSFALEVSLKQMLQSLLYQLGRRFPELPTALKKLCLRYKPGESQPSLACLFEGISYISANLSKVYLVIDALDELPSYDRHKLLSELFFLQEDLSTYVIFPIFHIPSPVNFVRSFGGTARAKLFRRKIVGVLS
jgi:Cdc6-like AAA superfamily ATPase